MVGGGLVTVLFQREREREGGLAIFHSCSQATVRHHCRLTPFKLVYHTWPNLTDGADGTALEYEFPYIKQWWSETISSAKTSLCSIITCVLAEAAMLLASLAMLLASLGCAHTRFSRFSMATKRSIIR